MPVCLSTDVHSSPRWVDLLFTLPAPSDLLALSLFQKRCLLPSVPYICFYVSKDIGRMGLPQVPRWFDSRVVASLEYKCHKLCRVWQSAVAPCRQKNSSYVSLLKFNIVLGNRFCEGIVMRVIIRPTNEVNDSCVRSDRVCNGHWVNAVLETWCNKCWPCDMIGQWYTSDALALGR